MPDDPVELLIFIYHIGIRMIELSALAILMAFIAGMILGLICGSITAYAYLLWLYLTPGSGRKEWVRSLYFSSPELRLFFASWRYTKKRIQTQRRT